MPPARWTSSTWYFSVAGATLQRFGDQIRSSNPLKRIGEPEDMAGIAIYLASRAGAYVTGAVIPVDGGMSGTK